MRAYRKKWADNNRERIKAAAAAKREANREEYNRYYREYHQKHKEKRVPYLNAHRRGRLTDATPLWADKAAIRHFYVACPEGHHVDHILPLRGKTVSGLHVLENLQYLPAEENLRKSNKCLI